MKNYVNNEKLYESIVKYKKRKALLEEEGKPAPQIPNDIGQAILDICEGIARRSNFRGYSYVNEMVSDAVTNCVYAVDKFDEVNYDKPFAYFTRIAWFAFLRRIEEEKKHSYIKHKSLENFAIEASLVGDKSFELSLANNNGMNSDLIKKFEK